MSARRTVLAGILALAAVLALGRGARAEEEAAAKEAREAIVAAAAKGQAALAKALDGAQKLVGGEGVFPDTGALADWLGTMPDDVAKSPLVRARRAWLYVVGKRGADAVPLLEAIVAADPGAGIYLAYLGEAKRQAGDVDGALAALEKAVKARASDEHVVPSLRKIVYDAHGDAKADAGGGVPAWARTGLRALAVRDVPELRFSIARWLAAAAEQARGADAKQAAVLRAEAAKALWPLFLLKESDPEVASYLPRIAYEAAGWSKSIGADRPADVPEPFDFYAMAVRLGASPTGETHEVPEAMAGLAEEALAKGRYLLASVMARRRLSISDSPAARRVLLALPSDVGE